MKKQYPQKIAKLAGRLEGTPSVSFEFLKHLVSEVNISKDELEAFAAFNHPEDQSYGRHLLYEGKRLKIYLMTWAPGDFTAIHDHGNTHWGCVVAMGDFTHRVYCLINERLKLKSNEPFLKGKVAFLDGTLIHMMGNAGSANIMSLHIYGSDDINNILAKRSRLYFPEKRKIITTNGPAFLYCSPEQIIEEEYYDSIDEGVINDYQELIKMRSDITSLRVGN